MLKFCDLSRTEDNKIYSPNRKSFHPHGITRTETKGTDRRRFSSLAALSIAIAAMAIVKLNSRFEGMKREVRARGFGTSRQGKCALEVSLGTHSGRGHLPKKPPKDVLT